MDCNLPRENKNKRESEVYSGVIRSYRAPLFRMDRSVSDEKRELRNSVEIKVGDQLKKSFRKIHKITQMNRFLKRFPGLKNQ